MFKLDGKFLRPSLKLLWLLITRFGVMREGEHREGHAMCMGIRHGDHIIFCPNCGTLLRMKRALTLTYLCWNKLSTGTVQGQLRHGSPYSLRVAIINMVRTHMLHESSSSPHCFSNFRAHVSTWRDLATEKSMLLKFKIICCGNVNTG